MGFDQQPKAFAEIFLLLLLSLSQLLTTEGNCEVFTLKCPKSDDSSKKVKNRKEQLSSL